MTGGRESSSVESFICPLCHLERDEFVKRLELCLCLEKIRIISDDYYLIIIEPLSEKTLAAAIDLGQRVFVNDDPTRITSTLQNSFQLDKENFLKTHQFVSMYILPVMTR